MAGLLGLSPSSVAPPPSVAATQTPAPQQSWAPTPQPTYSAPVSQPFGMQNWSANPAVPTAPTTQNPANPAAPVTADQTQPISNTLTQQTPDYLSQFMTSITSLFGQLNPQQASVPVAQAQAPTNQPVVNPGTTGLLAPDAFKRPDWIDPTGNTIQPTWTPPKAEVPVAQAQAPAAPATPTSPWAAGWNPYEEYEKANAGQLTMKDEVTGRMYNPNAHPYFNAYGSNLASGGSPAKYSPFGSIDARGYVTLNGTKQDPFDAWRQQQDSNRGN